MKFYVVLINGEVASLAHLSDEDAVKLRAFVDELAEGTNRIRVVESALATTMLASVKAEVEQELDSWTL